MGEVTVTKNPPCLGGMRVLSWEETVCVILVQYGWSPRLESNQYPTLRRHVHYPLCYGEDAKRAQL